MPQTPLATVLTTVTRNDDELASRARELAYKAIRIANDYLDSGSDKLRVDVIKSIMPAIGRGLSEKGESEELADMRKVLDQLMATMRGEVA